MALTATAQYALPREPVWDEDIVPTLRKRLKEESALLANRLSVASIASGEDPSHEQYASNAGYHSRQGTVTPTYQYPHERPTAIPRPSLQQARTTDESSGRTSQSSMVRARTYSQPFGLDSPYLGASVHSDERRPKSPSANGKVTRIPVSRGRSGSTTSRAQPSQNGSASRTEYTSAQSKAYSSLPSKKDNTELWILDEAQHSHTSRSTIGIPRRQASELFDEPAPFVAKSYGSSGRSYENEPRASSESEERPFEHWYRGDVSRNGGVGELRVARRQEMLDIANYGHTFRNASSRTGLGISSRSRSNSRSREASSSHTRGTRHRAESVGARHSIYLDEDEQAADASLVLDERPPTDIESDGYGYGYEDEVYPQAEVLRHPNGIISSPTFDVLETYAATPADPPQYRQASRTRIPTSTRRVTPPARTPSPPQTTRNPSEPAGSSLQSTPRAQVPRSQSQPRSATKRSAKSPARPVAATPKKPKTKQPPSAMQQRKPREEADRRSIGQYPTPEADDMADAIPTWTQPVPASGNWDDVVLPVVARKKGLEGHYIQTDGSYQPPKPKDVYEPQPGTFGYDHSKYRPPQNTSTLDEFGQRSDDEMESEKTPTGAQQSSWSPGHAPDTPTFERERKLRPSPPPSPPPFSHYAQDGQPIMVSRPPQSSFGMQQAEKPHEPEEDEAGCCKCVIM